MNEHLKCPHFKRKYSEITATTEQFYSKCFYWLRDQLGPYETQKLLLLFLDVFDVSGMYSLLLTHPDTGKPTVSLFQTC